MLPEEIPYILPVIAAAVYGLILLLVWDKTEEDARKRRLEEERRRIQNEEWNEEWNEEMRRCPWLRHVVNHVGPTIHFMMEVRRRPEGGVDIVAVTRQEETMAEMDHRERVQWKKDGF